MLSARYRNLLIVLGLQCALVYGVSWSERIPTIASLQTIRQPLGNWKLDREMSMEPDAIELLKPDDYLQRVYVDSTTHGSANVYVAYFRTQQTGLYPHSPKHCLPGSGWIPVTSGRVTIPGGAEEDFPANEYLLEKGKERILVLYWYQNALFTYSQEIFGKLMLLPELTIHRRSDVALVRVLSPIQKDSRGIVRLPLFELSRELHSALNKHMRQAPGTNPELAN